MGDAITWSYGKDPNTWTMEKLEYSPVVYKRRAFNVAIFDYDLAIKTKGGTIFVDIHQRAPSIWWEAWKQKAEEVMRPILPWIFFSNNFPAMGIWCLVLK